MPGAVYTELADLANEQYGFLTPDDAREREIDPINLVRMFQRGHLERRATGVYRLRLTPASSLDAYMEAVLWPGRGVRGVLSHDTALDLYGLNPEMLPVFRYDYVAQLALARKAHPERFPTIDPARNEDHTRELVGMLLRCHDPVFKVFHW